MMTAHRNPKYNANGTIDLEIESPTYGWMPFTADPQDPEFFGRNLFDELKDVAAPYVDPGPQPVPVPEVVSRFQARAALSQAGLLQQAQALIDQADEIHQIAWADAGEFRRSSPMLNTMAAQMGLTDSDLDDLFRTAITLEA